MGKENVRNAQLMHLRIARNEVGGLYGVAFQQCVDQVGGDVKVSAARRNVKDSAKRLIELETLNYPNYLLLFGGK